MGPFPPSHPLETFTGSSVCRVRGSPGSRSPAATNSSPLPPLTPPHSLTLSSPLRTPSCPLLPNASQILLLSEPLPLPATRLASIPPSSCSGCLPVVLCLPQTTGISAGRACVCPIFVPGPHPQFHEWLDPCGSPGLIGVSSYHTLLSSDPWRRGAEFKWQNWDRNPVPSPRESRHWPWSPHPSRAPFTVRLPPLLHSQGSRDASGR